MTTTVSSTTPTSSVDLYSDAEILSPYETYRSLRDHAAAVWLEHHGVWAISRYRDVYEALHDHQSYSSAQGIALTDEINRMIIGNSVATDPPEHDRIRSITAPQLTPRALRQYQPHFQSRAEELVDELIERGSFNAVPDFAERYPLSLIPDLLGWPDGGREHLLEWASAVFNAIGPLNDRTVAGLPALQQMGEFTANVASSGNLQEGSWGAQLLEKAKAGEISDELLPGLIIDYLAPSLDTTISSFGSMLLLLGQHPEQFELIREDSSNIPNAYNEILRYESPIRGFYRVTTSDLELDGVILGEGSRVLVLYASANRDERQFDDPETFDITRQNASSHVAFGHGVHACLGMSLARLEGHSLLTALANRVKRIEAGQPQWGLNNTIRALSSLEVRLRP